VGCQRENSGIVRICLERASGKLVRFPDSVPPIVKFAGINRASIGSPRQVDRPGIRCVGASEQRIGAIDLGKFELEHALHCLEGLDECARTIG
jgi:hypothetical protein